MRSCSVTSLSLKVLLYACVRIYNTDHQEHLDLELLGKIISSAVLSLSIVRITRTRYLARTSIGLVLQKRLHITAIYRLTVRPPFPFHKHDLPSRGVIVNQIDWHLLALKSFSSHRTRTSAVSYANLIQTEIKSADTHLFTPHTVIMNSFLGMWFAVYFTTIYCRW